MASTNTIKNFKSSKEGQDLLKDYRDLCDRMELFVKECTLDPEKGLPTFRQLAKRYHISQRLVEQIIEDTNRLGHNIGFRSAMGGIVEFETGDFTAEWAGDI